MLSIKAYYQKLLVREELALSHSSVWIPKAPKTKCFCKWLATRETILKADNWRNRWITHVRWCFMWWSEEDVNHLFLHCHVETTLRWKILNWFGVQWVMSSTVKGALYSWLSGKGREGPRNGLLPLWISYTQSGNRGIGKCTNWPNNVKTCGLA